VPGEHITVPEHRWWQMLRTLEKGYMGVVNELLEARPVIKLCEVLTNILKFCHASSKRHGAGDKWICIIEEEDRHLLRPGWQGAVQKAA
jgi:hypothetical protein